MGIVEIRATADSVEHGEIGQCVFSTIFTALFGTRSA